MNYLKKFFYSKGVCNEHPCKNNVLKFIVFFFLLIIIVIACIVVLNGKLFYQNLSESAPCGLYMVSPNQKLEYGDFAIVALPVDVPTLHVKKGFPMLKKIQGFPGDTYTIDDNGTYIHGNFYKSFQRSDLMHRIPGSYTVPENTILFLNDPEISFDSRYLGPISQDHLIKKVILIVPYELFDFLK